MYSYRSTFGVWHTLSCFKTNGWFVIAADGTTFVPVPDYGTFDLSSAKVSVEVKSVSTPELKVALKTPEQNFEKSVYGTWMTLGESKVEREYDGTLRMEVEEKNDLLDWTAANTGNMLMRERVFSTKGYSVDQPIVIDCCLDYGVGPQNYLAIKLGRSPLDATTPIKYEKMGKGSTVSVSPFADEGKLAYSETGSSVFIGALAISARIDVDDGLTDYYVAWNVKPNNQGVYQGISSLDRISFQVNDNGTDVFFNNIYAYTFKNMKRSFFAQSGYMAYPYICFSEIPRQPDKNNVLHLTGVNAPYDDGLPVKKYKSSDGDLNITLENYGAEISLYQDKDLKREVNAADYSYADGVLTLKRSFFTGRPFGLNEIFAASENGVRYLKVRYFPDDYVENPPTVAASQWDDLGVPTVVYDRKTVVSYTVENGAVKNIKTQDNTNDMRIKLSLNGYTFDYIYGWGILNSDYMYNEKQGTLLIRNSFLTEHANGSYSLVLVVRDEDDIARETKFNVSLVNYSAFEATYTEEIEGCGSAVQGETAVAVVLALCVLSFITVRTRKSKDNIK
ncbi:MAG: hypothetical protein J6Y43_03600 [Clostridia bacterium]|nr:hypothetical protein [Clostridia bacterium]